MNKPSKQLRGTSLVQVLLVDGRGSRGGATPDNAAYGATKAGLVQLKKSLAKEVQGSRVSVHIFSPGKAGRMSE